MSLRQPPEKKVYDIKDFVKPSIEMYLIVWFKHGDQIVDYGVYKSKTPNIPKQLRDSLLIGEVCKPVVIATAKGPNEDRCTRGLAEAVRNQPGLAWFRRVVTKFVQTGEVKLVL